MFELSLFKSAILILSAVILFLYGLEHFSREIHRIGIQSFQTKLEKFASNRWRGFALGAIFTALVQSSSAASALAVALVNSGLISFKNSIAILLGANVGTTLTAQLVALKLTGIGPTFIVLGTILSLLKFRVRVFGRIIFYFGFIFFTLDLISDSLKPFQESGMLLEFLVMAQNPGVGILVGALATFLVQSSSVVTGIIVLMVQNGAIPIPLAIPLVLGSNIGTTGTALIAAVKMDIHAKRAAASNAFINIIGVVAIFPFLGPVATFLSSFGENPAQVVANTHFAFNLFVALIFLSLLNPFAKGVIRILPQKIDTSEP